MSGGHVTLEVLLDSAVCTAPSSSSIEWAEKGCLKVVLLTRRYTLMTIRGQREAKFLCLTRSVRGIEQNT